MKKRLFVLAAALMLSAAMSIAPVCTADTDPEDGAVVASGELPLSADGFSLIASDGGLELYLNESDGGIAVKNTDGGAMWYSSPADRSEEKLAKGIFKMSLYSLLTLTVVDSESNSTTAVILNSYTECVLENGAVYSPRANGFEVALSFAVYGITVPIEVYLDGGALCVAVDTARIEETTPTWIRSMALMPYFGAGGGEDDGFILVPDGSGALINFNNGRKNAAFYESEIYGADLSVTGDTDRIVARQSYLPVFGLQNGGDGFLAVIDGAAANASVHAEVSGKRTSYNAVNAVFTLRDASVVSIGDNQVTDYEPKIKDVGTASVRYYFYSGGGGYSRMADIYRGYLIEKYGLSAKKPCASVLLQLLESYPRKKSFLGFEYIKQEKLTTYGEALDMIGELTDHGVDSLAVTLKNWDAGSRKETITSKPQPAAVLGGGREFNRLIESGKERNIPIFLSTRLAAYRQGNPFTNYRDAARTIENTGIRRYTYSLSTARVETDTRPQYLLSPYKLISKGKTMAEKFSKRGLTNITVDDAANMVYSDYTRSAPATKTRTAELMAEALSELKSSGMTLCAEGANAYALPYLDCVIGTPYTASGYDIEDSSVPFYQLVLNGIVGYTSPFINLSSDVRDMFLRTLEYGGSLAYVLAKDTNEALTGSYSQYYSVSSDKWVGVIAEQYAEYREVYEASGGMAVASHETLENGAAKVTYKNGAALIVNRSATPVETEYGEIGARSYLIVKGEDRG